MRVLFISLGSVGDVKPCLQLGLGLQRGGHEVIIAANQGYGEMAQSLGLKFVEISTSQDIEMTHDPDFTHPERGLVLTGDLLFSSVKPVMNFIKSNHLQGNTVIVAPTRVLGARLAQELWQIPLVSLHMAPLYLSTFDGYPTNLTDSVLKDRLNEVRSDLGLEPLQTSLVSWQYSSLFTVGLFPSWFAKPQQDWPRHTRLLDFPLAPEINRIQGKLRLFLESGPSPILFSPGTYTRDTDDFFRIAVNLCETSGRRGILTPVYGELPFWPIPDSIYQAEWVDYAALLPRVAAMVHAGGIGACAEALRAGIPQLMIPMVFDQRDNAERIVNLGAGLALSASEFRDEKAVEMVCKLLDQPGYAAKARALRGRVAFNLTLISRFETMLKQAVHAPQLSVNASR